MENENIYFEENETVEVDEVMDPVEVETEDSGIGAGMVALIAAGVVAAGAVAFQWVKKVCANNKAKKELRKPDEDKPVEPTDEQIEEVVTEEDFEK